MREALLFIMEINKVFENDKIIFAGKHLGPFLCAFFHEK